MPSVVTDNARTMASPPNMKGTKPKEETKSNNKLSYGKNIDKNAEKISPPKAHEIDLPDQNEQQDLNQVPALESNSEKSIPEAPVSSKKQPESKITSKTNASDASSRPRNGLDRKPPARASPPKPGLPRKPRSPSKSLTRKPVKTDPAPSTVDDSKQTDPQEAVVDDAGLALDLDEQDSPQQQQQQQQPKFVNSNALNLLKLAKSSHLAGDNPIKAINYASRAATLFEKEDGEAANLELVLCLHIVAAGYCRLGRYDEAIKVLESSVLIPNADQGSEHALAVFAGRMQLGDTLALVGKQESALASYHSALDLQKQVLGDMDLRVAETCRYISETHLQVMQFDEAQHLCKHVLDIHSKHSPAGSVDEAIDRKLMALIHAAKGEHEVALEHLVLASTTLSCSGQELDVASVDCSIGEAYFALGRYDEAVFSYQKALTILKSAKGDAHAAVAAVYVSLADLYLKTGRQREAKTYCENALKIFGKSNASGAAGHELPSGLVEVAGVYEAMGEREQALSLLRRALGILELAPGEQSAAAGVEAQMGVLLFVMGKFSEACTAFNSAISKLKFETERETTFLGVLFNQLALASVELQQLDDAVKNFEEAKRILEKAAGAHHPDTLAVCSNLAGCYDALGRAEDAISLLENVVEVKEELLGTVHPDVARDRERLLALLKGVGRIRARKTSTLEELLLLPNPEAAVA